MVRHLYDGKSFSIDLTQVHWCSLRYSELNLKGSTVKVVYVFVVYSYLLKHNLISLKKQLKEWPRLYSLKKTSIYALQTATGPFNSTISGYVYVKLFLDPNRPDASTFGGNSQGFLQTPFNRPLLKISNSQTFFKDQSISCTGILTKHNQ